MAVSGVPFKAGYDPRRNTATILKPGHAKRWMPGQSGNPAGLPQQRREYEEEFNRELMRGGSPKKAADLLWQCAEAKEAWAITLLLQRIAPIDTKVKVEVSRGPDADFNPAILSQEKLDQLVALMEEARQPVIEIEGETVAEQPAVEPEQAEEK